MERRGLKARRMREQSRTEILFKKEKVVTAEINLFIQNDIYYYYKLEKKYILRSQNCTSCWIKYYFFSQTPLVHETKVFAL